MPENLTKTYKSIECSYKVKVNAGVSSALLFFIKTKSFAETGLAYRIKVNRGLMVGMEYSVETKEQWRTKTKKKEFIEAWAETRGVISRTCEMVGISRDTYYEWRNVDPRFAKLLTTVELKRNKDVEDILMEKILEDKDPSCVKYYLDRKHPEYKPRMVQEVIAGERTLEDLIDEDNQKDENQKTIDRGTNQDTQQAESGGADEVQCSTGILLEDEEAKKFDIEG
jgi:hypothetical protein